MRSRLMGRLILGILISTSCFINTSASAGTLERDLMLAKRGQARAVIVLGDHSTAVERHAAQELVKYVRAMTGAMLDIVHGDNRRAKSCANIVLIGCPETNSGIRRLHDKGLVKLSREYPGLDGFVIKSVNVSGRAYLVLGGSEDRGTLYAVYQLLENAFHVGFFEDGEYIPKYTNLSTPHLDIAERPAFKVREYMQLCSTVYTAGYEGWMFPEWKYQADYCAKKKQNLLWVDFLWSVHVYLKRMVEAEYGVQNGRFAYYSDPASPADKFDIDLLIRLHNYIRNQLGLNVFGPSGADGSVSDEFRKARPDLPYVEPVHLSGVVLDTLIDPRSPEFADYVAKYINVMNRLLGTDHYYAINFPGESRTIKDPERAKTAKADFAKAVCRAVTAVDPKGIAFTNGWVLRYWTPDDVKQYCDGFAKDHFVTNDMWAEADPSKLYQSCDYFYGKNWLLGTLHSFGGDEAMFGDMQHAIDMYRNILADPKAINCQGTSIMPEITHHNPILWDLLMAVTWNPGQVTVDSQLKDIALRRYGRDSAAALYPALKKLQESVYGPHEALNCWPHMPRPVYRRNLVDLSAEREQYLKRAAYIPKLRRAVEIMISEAQHQRSNRLYENDLVDICNQYISEVMNWYAFRLWDAFKAGDSATFESCALAIEKCFDNKELILSSNSRYYLDTYVWGVARKSIASGRKIQAPGATVYEKALGAVKRIANPDNIEYAGRDRLELIKHYYRHKMAAYTGVLREKLARGDKNVSEADVKEKYVDVAGRYWEDSSAKLSDEDKYKGTVAQAAEETLKHLSGMDAHEE